MTETKPEPSTDPQADLSPQLLAALVCPVTKTALTYDKAAGELLSREARLAYPVREGIPIMLPEEARELSDEEVARLK